MTSKPLARLVDSYSHTKRVEWPIIGQIGTLSKEYSMALGHQRERRVPLTRAENPFPALVHCTNMAGKGSRRGFREPAVHGWHCGECGVDRCPRQPPEDGGKDARWEL